MESRKKKAESEKPLCGKLVNGRRCILERGHAMPREVLAPCTIESYGEGSSIEQFGCVGGKR